jgi:hypothetical protein
MSVSLMLMFLANGAVPALPGATYNSRTCRDCASFQANACSRPPPPMTSTLMFVTFFSS